MLRDVLCHRTVPRLVSSGAPHLAEVPAVGPEVHRGRQHRRTGAQRERRGASGQRRALTEELDLDASATDVAIAQQAQHAVGLHAP